jgi:molybdenum cofactor synthesis domain-containing protein
MEGIIKAICISEKRGTEKKPIQTAHFIKDYGIEGDAHAGHWHRQVSLLSYEKVEEFNQKGANVTDGAFGENILVSNIDFTQLPVDTLFYINDAILKLTQIGKECHSHCAIYHRVGDCIMPRNGVFCEVIKEGYAKEGDEVIVELPDINRAFNAAIITLSDKGSRNERVDESGPIAKVMLENKGYNIVETMIIPDEPEILKNQLIRLTDQRQVDLIITNGGTGFSLRDQTPEATLEVADRLAPGISEYIRMKSMEITNRAMFSRGVSVIRKQTLIINLPGSPKAVKESLEFILDSLDHALAILRGSGSECARK